MRWEYDDGGRKAAGFRGTTGDCGVRALAIAARIPYREAYDMIRAENEAAAMRTRNPKRRARQLDNTSPRNGTDKRAMRAIMARLGWDWVPTMRVGQGTTVHLRAGEIPAAGRLIVAVSRHYCAVVDGVIRDSHDPSREGTRCVYGYWTNY